MISVVFSIFWVLASTFNCYMGIKNDVPTWLIVLIGVTSGIQYYMMCFYISEYLFKQI
jgi:hypothetical protein